MITGLPVPWLEIADGDGPILLIAPHGGRAGQAARATLHPRVNDLETAAITRELARRLGAPALINAAMDRNDLDCNRLSQLTLRAPWLLELITDRIEHIIAHHGRATVLLIHGWNIIEPRVDLGLGLKETTNGLRPPSGAHISASDEFINGPVTELVARLRAAKILTTFGLRYPGGGAQNLLQAFTPRHEASGLPALRRLAAIATDGAIDALQLEMSVALRLPGDLREHNLDALAEIFSRPHNGATPPQRAVAVMRESIPHVHKKAAAHPVAAPSRIGIEFYDPHTRHGGMVSFDFGAGAAGGRITVLFDHRRVALFTAEGKASRTFDKISLGPLLLDTSARGRLEFRGPAVVVDDGTTYLSVEHALAAGRLDTAMEVAASLDFDRGMPAFDDLLASLENMLAQTQTAGVPSNHLSRSAPPHASFGRLRGTISLAGIKRRIDAAARLGVSFTGLGSQTFVARRMIWACFQGCAAHQAIEARTVSIDSAIDQRTAHIFENGNWIDCNLGKIEFEGASSSSPPKRITLATTTPAGTQIWMHGTPELS